MFIAYHTLTLIALTSLLYRSSFCEKLPLYQANVRNAGIIETRNVRSLLECTVLYKESQQSLSFNYHNDSKICELSSLYPESSTTENDWKVFAPVVDGVWGQWPNWGSCSKNCGGGTRSRSRSCNDPAPSNGGEPCHGSNTQSQSCNTGACITLTGGYYIGSGMVQYQAAKQMCKNSNTKLFVPDSQQKIDELFALNNNQSLGHWIGMTCTAGTDCKWSDGRSVAAGFQAWAPNEPNNGDCVYIGYNGNFWDDTHCHDYKRVICEQ